MHKHSDLPIIVLGAGLAGLSAAYTLHKNHQKVIVLEARDRIGGRVWTQHIEGDKTYHVELGGEWIGKQHKKVLDYVREFKLQLLPHRLDPALVLKGMYYRSGDWDFSQHWKKKFCDLLFDLKNSSPQRLKSLDKLDIVSFLENHGMTQDDIEKFSLLQRSMYGEDPRSISAYDAIVDNYILANYTDGIEDYYIRGGNELLPLSLANAIGQEYILRNKVVVEITQHASYAAIRCFDGTIYQAKRIICTIPATIIRSINWLPRLPIAKVKALESIRFSRVTKNGFLFHNKFWPENFHVLTEDIMSEIYHATQSQEGEQGVLCCYISGDISQPVSRMDDRERIAILKQALQPIFGDVKGIEQQYIYNWSDDMFAKGAYSIDQPSTALNRRETLQSTFGKIEFAGEHLAINQGYMDGAIDTGIIAAQKCLMRKK